MIEMIFYLPRYQLQQQHQGSVLPPRRRRPPDFLVAGRRFVVTRGESVTLPCRVKNLQSNGEKNDHFKTNSKRTVSLQSRKGMLSRPVFPFGCDESAAFLHQALFWIGSPTTLFYVDGTFIFFLLIFIHFCTRHGLI